jgi:hypothetical protein
MSGTSSSSSSSKASSSSKTKRSVQQTTLPGSELGNVEIKDYSKLKKSLSSNITNIGTTDAVPVDKIFETKDLNDLFGKLKGYVSHTPFANQANMRDSHSLVKGTALSFGEIGSTIVSTANKLGIKVTEDVGDKLIPVSKLTGAFKDSTFDDEEVKNVKEHMDACNALVSLSHNLAVFDILPAFINGEDFGLIYTRYWYVRHIQKIFYGANLSDIAGVMRISNDHKNDLVNRLKVFNTVTASGLFIDLIEKIIERIVIKVKSSNDKQLQDSFLKNCRTHFFSMAKTFEKSLPQSQKVKLTDSAKRRIARNPNARLISSDKVVQLVTVRPTIETKGFLEDKEKLVLKEFNMKLNEISKHIPEVNIGDGSARKSMISTFVKAIFSKTSHVNQVISRRKTLVHSLMVNARRNSHDLNEQKKIVDKVRFTPEEWRRTFNELDKSDLKNALIASFGTDDVRKLNISDLIFSIMYLSNNNAESTMLTSSEDDGGNMDS